MLLVRFCLVYGILVQLLTDHPPVSPEELQRYTSIIDGILATADLATISRKKIRQGLETSLGGTDLSEQKVDSPARHVAPVVSHRQQY